MQLHRLKAGPGCYKRILLCFVQLCRGYLCKVILPVAGTKLGDDVDLEFGLD